MSKLNRRDLLQMLGISSSLCYFPSTSFANSAIPDRSFPKIRSIIRLQMYAGWDVLMSCDPPREQYHQATRGSQQAWMTHWNFPSGVNFSRDNIRFGDGASANIDQSLAVQQLITNNIGTEFFNQTDKGMRLPQSYMPGQQQRSVEGFVPIEAKVGSAGQPFRELTEDPGWTRRSTENPDIAFGPLMHQFLEKLDSSPSGEAYDESYLSHMTVINGINTFFNVSHDAGAVLSACGLRPSGVGNGTDLTSLQFRPSIESIFAHQLVGQPGRYLPHSNIEAPLIPNLTFTYPGFRRGYAYNSSLTNLAELNDVVSLSDLNAKTGIEFPSHLEEEVIEKIFKRLNSEGRRSMLSSNSYLGLKGILSRGGLGLSEFETPEQQAFSGMIDIVLNKADTRPGPERIPGLRLRTQNGSSVVDYKSADPSDIRLSLDPEQAGSWQGNLATAAMMVRKGYTRGVSVSFGGHVNFIPDTHWHNDYVQMMYQGQFWDGVKRLINYLRWNKDTETGESLLDSTLVVVTADITRGPVYFDQGLQGKSDFRNNSMVLFGGGLAHSTKYGETNLPGRRIGYTYNGLEAGRVDLATGSDNERPQNTNERPNESITYEKIYASLLAGYGMDHKPYYSDDQLIEPLAKNKVKAKVDS